MIRTTERETYEAVWALPAYSEASPGEIYLPLFLDMAQPSTHHAILDAGCGAGKGALALQAAGFSRLTLCDLTDTALLPEVRELPFFQAALWDDLAPYLTVRAAALDWAVCYDVLEHIPPTFTMLVVSRLLAVAPRGVFLTISFMPDNFGPWVGKPLHQTLQSFTAWRDQLHDVGHVVEARDLLHVGAFLVEPR